jgi:hypothetical protein
MTSVALKFDLPPVAGQAGTALAPIIEKWIGSLPLLNTAQSSRALLDRLAQLNRQALDESDRLRILEMFREPVHGVCVALMMSYDGQALPLGGAAREAAQRVQSLYDELSIGYKRLAADASSRETGADTQRGSMALYLHRALHAMGCLLTVRFGRYAPALRGAWHTIHELYRCAEAAGLADTAVPDPLNACVPAPRVSHVYIQALLLDLAGPFQMPPRMIGKVHRFLDAMAPLAQLTKAIPALRPDCQFVVNLAADRAGVTNAENAAVTTEARYRFLGTAELAAAMYAQYQALQQKQAPALHGLAPDFFGPNGADMLKRLLVAWGVHPRRHLPRIPRPHTVMMVDVGLDAVCQLANHGLPFERSSNLVGPMPKPPARSGQDPSAQDPSTARATESESTATWALENEGAGGFCLSIRVAPKPPVQVGDLIAARQSNNPKSFDVAVVRWVMYGDTGDARLGAQRLSASATTIGLAPAQNPDSAFHVALRLPALPALKQTESLITPLGCFRPDRELVLDDGMRTHRITATRLVNLTGSFEQFEFRMPES